MRTLLCLIPMCLVMAGCATNMTAYKTLAGIGWTVDGGMTAYADAVVADQVTPAQQAQVRELHGKYQRIYGAAVAVARNDLGTMAPQDLANVAAELTALLITLTQ